MKKIEFLRLKGNIFNNYLDCGLNLKEDYEGLYENNYLTVLDLSSNIFE
jgi:hypothetical protein